MHCLYLIIFYLNSVLLDHFLMIYVFKPTAIMIITFIVFFLRTISDWNSLPSRALVLIQIFHFLKITVSQLLEMIDGCHLFIFFYHYLSYLFVYKYILYLLKNNFIFYFYFYLIFTLLLYFWYCNLFNLYWVDAKELSVNICRCRCNKGTPGFEPFTGKRNAINT